MHIIKADRSHKDEVLRLLDDFRTACYLQICPEKGFISTTAKEKGGLLFDRVIDDPDFLMYLAKEGDSYIGLISGFVIPQIRKGACSVEIEEVYVDEKSRGTGAAQKLMQTILDWAKANNIIAVRLETNLALKRAHRFYEKMGFEFKSKGYEIKIS